MTIEMAIALIGFAFVMSISPGPANLLLLVSGANFGFARSVPAVLGVCAGFLSMVFVIGLGLGQVFERFPAVYTALRFASGAYVLWLAYKIATSRSIGSAGGEISKPITFPHAALLQLVNPKAWAVALIVTVSYTDPARYFTSLVAMILVFAVVNVPSIGVWALAGMTLHRTLSKGRRIMAFNATMALLLIGSMIPVLFDLR